MTKTLLTNDMQNSLLCNVGGEAKSFILTQNKFMGSVKANSYSKACWEHPFLSNTTFIYGRNRIRNCTER